MLHTEMGIDKVRMFILITKENLQTRVKKNRSKKEY